MRKDRRRKVVKVRMGMLTKAKARRTAEMRVMRPRTGKRAAKKTRPRRPVMKSERAGMVRPAKEQATRPLAHPLGPAQARRPCRQGGLRALRSPLRRLLRSQ